MRNKHFYQYILWFINITKLIKIINKINKMRIQPEDNQTDNPKNDAQNEKIEGKDWLVN